MTAQKGSEVKVWPWFQHAIYTNSHPRFVVNLNGETKGELSKDSMQCQCKLEKEGLRLRTKRDSQWERSETSQRGEAVVLYELYGWHVTRERFMIPPRVRIAWAAIPPTSLCCVTA